MILTAHQPLYLPWLGLFHKISLADVFCVFDVAQYQKKDFNNRNRIKGPNGPMMLTVPVHSQNHFELSLHEAEIHDGAWRRKHLRSIASAYRKAPFFDQHFPFFEQLFAEAWERLVPLDMEILNYLLAQLGLSPKIVYASELGLEGKKSALVLDMCLKLEAKTYVFGSQGRDYADVAAFERAGVTVYFQDYVHPVYPQQFGSFEAGMSVIDLLFNCGPESLATLLEGNINRRDVLAGNWTTNGEQR